MNIPERGQIIWTTFDPKLGHEQGGRRPALVISNSRYNERTGLMICMPITSKVKNYTSEIPLPDSLQTRGVVLSTHVYTMDWQVREIEGIEFVPAEVLAAVLKRLATVILQ